LLIGFVSKIRNRNGNFLHPAGLGQEKYEELKNLVPGACKVKNCYREAMWQHFHGTNGNNEESEQQNIITDDNINNQLRNL